MPESTPPSSEFLGDGGANGILWWYNWAAKGSGQAAGIEYDPMVWGAPLPSSVAQAQYLLTFNEPDNSQQYVGSNLSATKAASYWPQIQSLAQAAGIPYIVSPAVQSQLTWMQSFMSACTNCQIDYIAVHFYGCSLNTTGQFIGLAQYLQQFYQFNKPIWLTEFSCDPTKSVAAQTAYMQAAVPYLESEPHVFRYSWFSASKIPNAMLTQGGALNSLGQVYVSLPEACKP
jgi:hypothetical protein